MAGVGVKDVGSSHMVFAWTPAAGLITHPKSLKPVLPRAIRVKTTTPGADITVTCRFLDRRDGIYAAGSPDRVKGGTAVYADATAAEVGNDEYGYSYAMQISDGETRAVIIDKITACSDATAIIEVML